LNVVGLVRRALCACARRALPAAALWPGPALALSGGVRIECGQHSNAWAHYLLVMAGVSAVIAGVTLAAWGAHALWQRHTGRRAEFSLSLAAVIITGLLLIASGISLSPAPSGVYASFGVELSTAARVLMDYPFLLSVPLILFPFLLMRVESDPRREQYFAAFAALEFALLCVAQWVLNIPIVVAC
jgi:hypothetical protein